MNTNTKPEVSTVLFTDTETWSTEPIKDVGTVKYCESADMLLGGFYLDGKYGVYDFSTDAIIPDWVLEHADQGGWFCAHNALFDYIILKKHIPSLQPNQFIDTMAYAAAAGLPMSLEKAGEQLEIDEDKQKLKDGKRLVMKFCVPRKPSKYNSSTRVMPEDAPEEWKTFRDEYLRNDVLGMVELYNKLPGISDWEQEVWCDTQTINLEGIPIDVPTATSIIKQIDKLVDDESSKFIRLTSMFPTQRDKVLGWCRANGLKITNLQAATVEKALADPNTPALVKEALIARANTTHMSFKKYPKMLVAARDNGTVGGTLVYYGAHTGRFGGRLLQPQNLTRGTIDGNEAVERIQAGEFSVDLVKSAVRPMIYHPQGFTIADFVGVEARGVQWVCQDHKALDVFTSGQDPYIVMASEIYEIPYYLVDSKQRFVGKQAILGLGYQMSKNKFISMVENYGETITNAEATKAVAVYRAKHKKLVQFWKDIENAALMAMDHPDDTVRLNKYISFEFSDLWLSMILPSGRRIRYFKPNVEFTQYGRSISYMSTNDRHQYVRTQTYGGKLTENAVQGLCRDLLVVAVNNLLRHDYRVVTHIHDEVVVCGDVPKAVETLMCMQPDWAEGFPLDVEVTVSPRYIKA